MGQVEDGNSWPDSIFLTYNQLSTECLIFFSPKTSIQLSFNSTFDIRHS